MISVIIPTLNEEANLPSTLASLQKQGELLEILVVDAGSTDGTQALAREAGARVIVSDRRQRAHQLNLGATAAQGEALWFLHADTWVDPLSSRSIARAMENPTVVGGGFKRRFRSASPFLMLTCVFASLRSRWFGLYFGDQSMWVRSLDFTEMGGFEDVPVFEDFDFCQRLKKRGRMDCLGPAVRSSARRFEKRGALAVTLHDLWLTVRYHCGMSPYKIWERINRRRD
ncbi:MAG: rSAM/selenodomain-associated transferase 2 [Verrucomicrobiales bacterium]